MLPGAALIDADHPALLVHRAALVALAGVAQALRIDGVRRRPRHDSRAAAKERGLKGRGWLGLHSSIWKVASTHVVVDAYTNIYAPMLPLLIPRLEPVAGDGRNAGDVFPDGELGVATGVRRAGRSLAAAAAGHGRAATRGGRAQHRGLATTPFSSG